MKKTVMGMALVSIMFTAGVATAGKVEDVQAEIKKSCSKDMPKDEALRMVKNLFLSCVPGEKVDVEGCKVACLKENSGAVVGQ